MVEMSTFKTDQPGGELFFTYTNDYHMGKHQYFSYSCVYFI